MRAYLCIDDTDNLESIGTGKLLENLCAALKAAGLGTGSFVTRHQLFVHEDIPYTSHNSSACLIVEAPGSDCLDTLRERAVRHIETQSLAGSDPGLCIAWSDNGALAPLVEFGRRCTERVVPQAEAVRAAKGFHLSGHGGTNDGIIGAAAAVGLTASGWSGRFIEFARLRELPVIATVASLEERGMSVVSMDRDALSPRPGDRVDTKGWLRPRLLGHRAVVPVLPSGDGLWYTLWEKRSKTSHGR